jgi:Skp family chaperone for outer membrane proteins
MKKQFLVIVALFAAVIVNAQSRGIKIAYIDMEYILEKVPDYAEAKNQLELKAQKWKQEIEVKKNDINKLKESLKAEKVLLTKELITEREEEIAFLEKDLLDFQEKRFGPKGDLISQKAVLVKPIQDQVFTIVQDISEAKKYDFVFDKSSDLTMLFAAQRHDISDQVIRRMTRSAKREQLSSKEIKRLEEQEAKEDLADDPDFIDKQKAAEEKKAARQKIIDDRKAKRQEALDNRERLKQERLAKRNGAQTTAPAGAPATNNNAATPAGQDDLDSDDAPTNSGTSTNRNSANTGTVRPQTQPQVQGENSNQVKTTATEVPEEGTQSSVDRQNNAQALREQKAAERKAILEERKKQRQQKLDERAAAKKAREENNKPEQQENKNEN